MVAKATRKEHIMKSENYIVINGKKAELTEEQLKALGLKREIESPFKKKMTQNYWFIYDDGTITETQDFNHSVDVNRHRIANYCTNVEMMEQRALHETLNRLLWRYSMEHKGNEIGWETHKADKWDIVYDHDEKKLKVYNGMYYQHTGVVYFHSHEIAENAIKEIIEPFMAEHPNFKL